MTAARQPSAPPAVPPADPAGPPPLVSVCVITYNHRPYLAQALDSVLMQQTEFPFEILLHDDCSTDGTAELVRAYAQRLPHLITAVCQSENQYSQGRKAFPALFKMARGKYLTLLEGDDAWTDPQKLAKQAAFLEMNPDCVICFGNVRLVDDEGRGSPDRRIPDEHCRRLTREEMVKGQRIMPTSTVMFRNVPELGGWMTQVNRVLNGDNFLFAMLAQSGEAGYVDISPSLYRQHAGGIYSSLNQDQRRAAKLQTLRVIHHNIDRSLRPWVLDAISMAMGARTEILRRQGRRRSMLSNLADHLWFELRWRRFRAFRRTLLDGIRQTRRMIIQSNKPMHVARDSSTVSAQNGKPFSPCKERTPSSCPGSPQ